MTSEAAALLEAALALPAVERAEVAEALLASLSHPTGDLDEVWAREADARIAAFEAGEVPAFPAEEVHTL